jgi:hypothetical protein
MAIRILGTLALALPIALAWLPPAAGAKVTDTDMDGTADFADFCTTNPTAPSPCGFDDDMDGYGNACDGDFTQDGVTDFNDVAPFGAGLGVGGPGPTDMNCDGVTDFNDVAPFGAQLGAGSPGPSGLPCAGTVPCP